jgi:hypothetical protein
VKTKLVATAIGAAFLVAPIGALAAVRHSASQLPLQASPQAVAQTVNWQIPLSAGKGIAGVTGSSQYQAQPGQRELQIEIEHLRSLAGQSLLVQVNGGPVGAMKVSGKGIAQLTRNTERGQATPIVAHGSIVTVRTKAGIVLASGRF